MGKVFKRLGSGACDVLQKMITDVVLREFGEDSLAAVSADVAVELMVGAAGELAADVESMNPTELQTKWLNGVRYAVADAISGLGKKVDVQQDAEVLEYIAMRKDAMAAIREFEALVVADATSDQNMVEAKEVVDKAIAIAEQSSAA